jgi:hypothetical protein
MVMRRFTVAIPASLLCLAMSLASIAADGREFSKISFLEVREKFIKHESRMTEVQRAEAWQQFSGQWVRWTGIVRDVTTTWGTLYVHVDMGVGSMSADLLLCPTERMVPVAKKLMKGDRVYFTGRLDRLPGKFLATALRDVEFANPSSAEGYYPICLELDRRTIGFTSSNLSNQVIGKQLNESRRARLISTAMDRGEAGLLKVGSCIVVTGEVSGAVCQAHFLGDNDLPFWIPNHYLRSIGIPVADKIDSGG